MGKKYLIEITHDDRLQVRHVREYEFKGFLGDLEEGRIWLEEGEPLAPARARREIDRLQGIVASQEAQIDKLRQQEKERREAVSQFAGKMLAEEMKL